MAESFLVIFSQSKWGLILGTEQHFYSMFFKKNNLKLSFNIHVTHIVSLWMLMFFKYLTELPVLVLNGLLV